MVGPLVLHRRVPRVRPGERLKVRSYVSSPHSLQGFAEKNGLEMEVHDRGGPVRAAKFYAFFAHAEVKREPCFLEGAFGNGETPENAMRNYVREIAGKVLVFDATNKAKRLEIYVPADLFYDPQAVTLLEVVMVP